MERLTERLENGVINVKYASQHETAIHRLVTIEDILGDEYDLDRLRELGQADREGRCVVLPVPLHKTLLDTSDPYRPELMKDFRISATWTHRGIVFHSPWDIFLENIESGYIRVISAEAEAALRREQDEQIKP